MDEQLKLGFAFAKDFAEQLITLSTGIIALSVAFTKDLVGRMPQRSSKYLGATWFLFLISIMFGLMHLMALTGQLAPVEISAPVAVIGFKPRLFGVLQVLAFLFATVSAVLYGFVALRYYRKISTEPKSGTDEVSVG